MIFRIALAFMFCLCFSLIFKIAELAVRLGGTDSDGKWHQNWFWEKSYFVLFTVSVAIMLMVLQPTEKLTTLA